MKNLSTLLLGAFLAIGMFLTSCQNSPTGLNNEREAELVTSSINTPLMAQSSGGGAATPLVILDGGAYHQAAYFPADGNFIAWGDDYSAGTNNRYGEAEDYLEGEAVAFANGAYTNCILTTDGNTVCKGYNADELSYNGGDAVSFDVGYGQACVVTEDGNINCYGSYLGASNSWKPIYTGGDAEWLIMSDYAACYKTAGSGNTLTCKGWNVTEASWTVEGTPTPSGEGHYAMCVLTEEGDIDCMNNGYNDVGQTVGYYGGDAIAFDADFDLACFVKENGDVDCFGRGNEVGGPMSIPGVNAVAVSVSSRDDICYATADGEITCTRSTPDEYTPINGGGDEETNLFISDGSVLTWDPIYPSPVYSTWQNACTETPVVGLDANWQNEKDAFVIEQTASFEGIAGYQFEAEWINAWNSLYSIGDAGQTWTKYSTTVNGDAGEYVVQFLADNCSWIYLDGNAVGFQDDAFTTSGNNGKYPVTLDGTDQELTFIIFDGGGQAGGKFRLETLSSFEDNGGSTDDFGGTNTAPTANAGTDQTLDATAQATSVTLDGSASSDADGGALSYSWTLDGNEVSTDESFTTSLSDGSYTFTLTVSDGETFDSDEVSVKVLNTIPTADAGSDQTIEATGPLTSVTLSGSGSDADGDALTYSWSNGDAGATTTVDLGVGSHTFTLTVSDGQGASATDEVTVNITDTTAPEIAFDEDTNNLWPPNHKMVLVASNILATDLVDGSTSVEVSVASNEPSNGKGDGNTDSDYEISTNADGSLSVYVRAERSGKGKGRTYTITFMSMDALGNTAMATMEASVAKSKGQKNARR